MGVVYLATYSVSRPEDPNCGVVCREGQWDQRPTEMTSKFMEAVRREEWLYDVGDDPSFFCAKQFAAEGGALTWGICRRNLRCPLNVGDVVAFFGHRKLSNGDSEYYFSGYATVAQKVTQTDIWNCDSLAVYRRYLNLVIRPANDGYLHSEAHPGPPHPDWLWRMTTSKGHEWKKEDFRKFERQAEFRPGEDRAANGELVELAKNYVIFASTPPETFLLEEPVAVAKYDKAWGSTRPEEWLGTTIAQEIKRLTIDQHPYRNLRVHPRNPHIRLPRDPCEWRPEMYGLL